MRFKSLRVYVVGRTKVDLDALEAFLADNDLVWFRDEEARDAEIIVEAAGRVCYMSFTDDKSKMRFPNVKYVRNLIQQEHESVLEHASWTFLLDGVSRALSHQLVRHRVGFAFSQLSQQYHDESEAAFVVPHGINPKSSGFEIWKSSLRQALLAYREALSSVGSTESSTREQTRHKRSVARSLLPNATSTTLAVTANARALRHFFRVRGTIEGDYEMRALCVEMLKQIRSDAPSLFQDFSIAVHGDGIEIIKHEKR